MPFTTAAVAAAAAPTVTAAGYTAAVSTTFMYGATAATIAADAALVAGGVGAFSSIQAGQQAEQLGKDKRAIYEYNARLDEQEAIERQDAAGYKETQFRTQAEHLKASMRAGYAKAGVTTEGSPMDYLESKAISLESDALTIRREGTVAALDLGSSADLNRYAGRSALTKGRNIRRASYYTAAGQGIGGLGGSFNTFNKLS